MPIQKVRKKTQEKQNKQTFLENSSLEGKLPEVHRKRASKVSKVLEDDKSELLKCETVAPPIHHLTRLAKVLQLISSTRVSHSYRSFSLQFTFFVFSFITSCIVNFACLTSPGQLAKTLKKKNTFLDFKEFLHIPIKWAFLW